MPRQVEECQPIQFRLVADDFDLPFLGGDRLVMNIQEDDGLVERGARFHQIDETTCDFFWQPDFQDAGEYNPVFRVTDSFGGFAELPVRISVGNVNRPPRVMAPIPGAMFEEDDPEQLIADLSEYITDPDGDALQFVVGEVPGLDIRLIGSVLFVQPRPNWHGEVWVPITADDQNGGVMRDSILAVVNPVNDLPSPFSLIRPAEGDSTAAYPDIEFVWHRSFVIVEDSTVTYALVVWFNGEYHWFRTGEDTSRTIPREEFSIDPNQPTTVAWWVWAYDGVDSVASVEVNHFWVAPLSVREWDGGRVPDDLTLGPVYPNPFNRTVTIEFGLPAPGAVDVTIYDPSGRVVQRLEHGSFAAGRYRTKWDGRDAAGREVSSGLYLCRLRTPQGVRMKRMVLIR